MAESASGGNFHRFAFRSLTRLFVRRRLVFRFLLILILLLIFIQVCVKLLKIFAFRLFFHSVTMSLTSMR